MIGELISHYRVQELVGRGAMGVVYKALDVNIDRQVAIKVMSVEARSDPAFVERFHQEARMQGALNHPNIALLFDYFVHKGAPIAVMEFIDGESLDQLIRRRGAIPAHESIPIFKQALLGVAAAHRAGIIHRDLKAANLMITRSGLVKVMDFGVAKRPDRMDATKASTSVGSPLCMAPEQILGRNVDVRTDVYALGVTLYQLLTGQPPFNPRDKSAYSVLNAHVNDLPEPPTVHRRDIPRPIVSAVMRAIAKEPDARFQSAEEFMRALPDVAAPMTAAPADDPSVNVAEPQVGPTGTMVIPRAAPTGASISAPAGMTAMVANQQMGPTGTLVIPRTASVNSLATPTHRDPSADTVMFDYSPRTGQQTFFEPSGSAAPAMPSSVQGPHEERRGLMPRLRASRPAFAALLIATLLLGLLLRHRDALVAMLMGPAPAYSNSAFEAVQAPVAMQTAASSQNRASATRASIPIAAPPAQSPAPAADSTAAPSPEMAAARAVFTPTATAAPARQDLSGLWRGEYFDAAGKPLLHVLSLRIRQVRDDGGIEGMLQYRAASGMGECRLLPGGSSYSSDKHTLQLSPEGCSPHYPKELGVPLDFDGVKPQATSLNDGRIEAPTGEVIRAQLKRVN